MKKLQNWEVVTERGLYVAPERDRARLQGNVYGHSKFRDGEAIRTSYITGKEKGKIVSLWISLLVGKNI